MISTDLYRVPPVAPNTTALHHHGARAVPRPRGNSISNPCLTCGTITGDGSRCRGCKPATPPAPRPERNNRTARGYGYAHQQAARKLYGQPCTYCGQPSDTADHLIPLAHGGTSTPDNLVPACRSCNSRRGSRTRRA